MLRSSIGASSHLVVGNLSRRVCHQVINVDAAYYCNNPSPRKFCDHRFMVHPMTISFATQSRGLSQMASVDNAKNNKKDNKATKNSIAQHQTMQNTRRPVLWWERFRDFPSNVKQLVRDAIRYKNIYDTVHTPRNAWNNKLPRRQREETRKFVQDLYVVFPTVLLWIPPIIGYIPMFAAVLAPRQVLSRQFHNAFERHHFAILEYRQRRDCHVELANHVWSSVQMLRSRPAFFLREKLGMSAQTNDAAGPVFENLEPLYRLFEYEKSLYDLESYPHEILVALALTSGLYQRFPWLLPKLLVRITPPRALFYAIRDCGKDVCIDDILLWQSLEESGHRATDAIPVETLSLTDDEVIEACLLRALPVSGDLISMRECLINHVQMMRRLRDRIGYAANSSTAMKETLRLFTLHLSSIRYDLQQTQGPQ